MNKKNVFLCEVGVLLNKSDTEFDNYNNVWNHEYGFYDENATLFLKKEEAKEYAITYVKNGVDNTYAILADEGLCDCDEFNDEDYDISEVISGEHNAEDIIYCIAKINGKIIENFLKLN